MEMFFILDKWCAGNKDFGISEWETNIWKSYESLQIGKISTFHFDEFYYLNNYNGDETLLNLLKKEKPTIICLVLYKMPGSDHTVPKIETIKSIALDLKIPIISIWGDLEIPEQIRISKSLNKYVQINCATASSAAVKRLSNENKYFYSWVPKDERIFNNPNFKRDINVSYVGSLKNNRLTVINFLQKRGIDVSFGGGERTGHLTTDEYAKIFKRSKITISFSRASNSHVINARPFEAMSCGAMLLEQENFETPKLFIPYVDYVPYSSNEDLHNKIVYYLEHDDQREKIANSGNQKIKNYYNTNLFWTQIVNKVLYGDEINTNYIMNLSSEKLIYYSTIKKIKLIFLDKICSNKFGFKLYILISSAPDYIFLNFKKFIGLSLNLIIRIVKFFFGKTIYNKLKIKIKHILKNYN